MSRITTVALSVGLPSDFTPHVELPYPGTRRIILHFRFPCITAVFIELWRHGSSHFEIWEDSG